MSSSVSGFPQSIRRGCCDRKRFVHDIADGGFAQKSFASALAGRRSASAAVACKHYNCMKNKQKKTAKIWA
jgi:hypothetical protein